MDILGGTAFAVVLEDGDVRFQMNDVLSEWDEAFKSYTKINSVLKWAT